MSDQAPPQSLQTEEAVIGAILLNQAALQRVTIDAGLKAEHFYYEKHRDIYAAAQRVAAREGVADQLTVGAELPALRDYTASLTDKAPAPANAPVYARRLVHLAGLRAKLAGAQEIIEGVHEGDDEKVSNGLLTASADIEAESAPTTPEEIGSWMVDWIEEGERLRAERGPDDPDPDLFPLPWPELNASCAGGFKRGQMITLTGWSGMGKSNVLEQMVHLWAQRGARCLALTTEMGLQEIVARHVARQTGVPYERTVTRNYRPDDWKRAMPALGSIPFHHHDAEGWNVDRILAAIAHKQPDVAYVDPWNLIPHSGRDRRESEEETARRLKEIARRANCLLIVVAHLNTARLKEGAKPRPTQGDIRGTGMLYNNAHNVVCLHRENAGGKAKRDGEIFFMKGRDAPEGSFEVEFNVKHLRFDRRGARDEVQQQIDTTPQPEDVFPE